MKLAFKFKFKQLIVKTIGVPKLETLCQECMIKNIERYEIDSLVECYTFSKIAGFFDLVWALAFKMATKIESFLSLQSFAEMEDEDRHRIIELAIATRGATLGLVLVCLEHCLKTNSRMKTILCEWIDSSNVLDVYFWCIQEVYDFQNVREHLLEKIFCMDLERLISSEGFQKFPKELQEGIVERRNEKVVASFKTQPDCYTWEYWSDDE